MAALFRKVDSVRHKELERQEVFSDGTDTLALAGTREEVRNKKGTKNYVPRNPISRELVLILFLVSPAGLYWTLLLDAGEMDIEPDTSLLPNDPEAPTAG